MNNLEFRVPKDEKEFNPKSGKANNRIIRLPTKKITLLFVFQRGSDFAINNLLSINTCQTNLVAYKLQLINKLQKHIKV